MDATPVTIACQRGNFELNVMMPVIADSLLESVALLANASRVFAERCVAGIAARPERARELLERNPSIATALNAYIGYDQAAVVAKRAASEDRSVREVVEEMEPEATVNRPVAVGFANVAPARAYGTG